MPRRVRVTPTQAADKHIRNTTAAVQYMRQGVEAVTESPTEAAAKKIDKMQANFLAAIQSGKVERGLRRVSLADWKEAMLTKGVGRVASGVEASRSKQEAFYSDLFAYEDQLLGKIDAMNDLTLEDSIQRMTEWVRGMSKFERS